MSEADKGRIKGLEEEVKQLKDKLYGSDSVTIDGITYTKDKLLTMKMKELREIGNKVGAKDTSKSELIDEILRSG